MKIIYDSNFANAVKKQLLFILAFLVTFFCACNEKNTPTNPGSNSSTSTSNDSEVPTPLIDGELSGIFSVSETKKVHFSQGNLQANYNDSSWTWTFANNQWDFIGDAVANNAINGNGTVSSNGTVDLFGWSTASTYYGIYNVTNNAAYSGNFVDWGTNAITNGGNQAKLWRTLTKDEWVYLFHGRTNAATLFGLGKVNGINGMIILPDNWTLPTGASFTASTTQGLTFNTSWYRNDNGNNFSHNTYTAEQWLTMESAGAVFLPGAGSRDNTTIYVTATLSGPICCYWSATRSGQHNAFYFNFGLYYVYLEQNTSRFYGHSVRLVR